MENAIELLAAINLLIMGISHIVQPRAWVDFFTWLRGKGHAGVFVVGFLSLSFGVIVVAFHNVWAGLPMLLTLLGWSQVIKGAIYFVVPQIGMKSLSKVALERAWVFIVGGIFLLALDAVLWYVVATHGAAA